MSQTTFLTSLLALTTAVSQTTAPAASSNSNIDLPFDFEYVGCIVASPDAFPNSILWEFAFTSEECISQWYLVSSLVAIGGKSGWAGCYADDLNDNTPIAYTQVEESQCTNLCAPGDGPDGQCEGVEGTFKLYRFPGARTTSSEPPAQTVPPVVPCTTHDLTQTVYPTPEAQQAAAVQDPCPPEGCAPAAPVPAPAPAYQAAAPAPANNSTYNASPAEGNTTPLPDSEGGRASAGGSQDESADDQAGGASSDDSGSSDEQGDSSDPGSFEQSDSSGSSSADGQEGGAASGEAPSLVSESPRLYSSGILSAIVAVIFGLTLM
ncbi:hypothetical protein FDECE_17561 [Fusarium decemcellulare]|nr:hypothetical protein FDECE_17561 [Fusarium decemcellulare]